MGEDGVVFLDGKCPFCWGEDGRGGLEDFREEKISVGDWIPQGCFIGDWGLRVARVARGCLATRVGITEYAFI